MTDPAHSAIAQPRHRVPASLAIWVLVTGCSILVGPIPRAHIQQPPRPVPIQAVAIADDGLSVRIDFIGGAEFDPNDPCTRAYVAEVEVGTDDLSVGVFALEHPKAAADVFCTLIGYQRTLVATLDRPFHGTRVLDRAGYVILLAAPQGLVQIKGLPGGWSLQHEESLQESPTGRWSRTYAPAPDPGLVDAWVQLIQAFNGPAGVTGGDLQPDASINGIRASFYLHGPSGEMVLVWTIGDDGVALVGNLRDFTAEEFIQLAESIVPAD
jgi:hypothetical protein